jgi:tetratricopeptide (TPR) repeat protein
MAQITELLYRQLFRDNPKPAYGLTQLDLANLLGALEYLGATASAESVVQAAARLEQLLSDLGRPKALARASRVREVAATRLGEWSHAQSAAEQTGVDRLLESGRFPEATAAAWATLKQAEAAGESAYVGAAYDLALAYLRVGRSLARGGDAAAALVPLREARDRFQALADAGSWEAAAMASAAITDAGDCFRDLGRLDEAASAYEEAIERDEQRRASRDLAVGKVQLGTVRMLQRRYDQALAAYEDAKHELEQLGELRSVAIAWHQIGMVLQRAQRYGDAEAAYQASLRIEVQAASRPGEASTLNQLGTLYNAISRTEEAVGFYQQAATIYQELSDLASEGRSRYNLANTLLKLGRYNDARREILRAIECDRSFGHAAEPWKTFDVLVW